ncbi:MAG: hypothetical protein M3Y87_36930, partial [Myxococcota bacterium]|nr:hypothetical protein [Myxococcota bacterium]
VLAIALLPLGCGGGAATTSTSTTTGPTAASAPSITEPIVPSEGALNGPPAAPPAIAETATASTSAPGSPGEIIALPPGFRPDPIVRRGTGGGPIDAASIDGSCIGYITSEPTFVMKLDGAVPDLRVLVHMQGDATLVVQLADGSVLCNDDSEGLDPIVEGRFPPGRHRVWVGTYSESGAGASYTIAFSRQRGLSTMSLDGMAETP